MNKLDQLGIVFILGHDKDITKRVLEEVSSCGQNNSQHKCILSSKCIMGVHSVKHAH